MLTKEFINESSKIIANRLYSSWIDYSPEVSSNLFFECQYAVMIHPTKFRWKESVRKYFNMNVLGTPIYCDKYEE